MNKNKISVLGGGSWGTVLAHLASLNGNEVTLWMRDEEVAKEINNTNINSRYLPNLTLGSNLIATSEMADISDSGIIIFCIPSDAFRDVSGLASNYIKEESFLVTATKGVEKDGFSLMSNILADYFPRNAIGVLSGPNLAEEIASNHLSGTVIASENKILVQTIICLLYTSPSPRD